jgi:hypothetical protein
MANTFDPAEIDVIEDDYTSNLSGDESENASTRRILGLCEYARELGGGQRIGYTVVCPASDGPERRWENNWDGEIHSEKDKGLEELRSCREAGYEARIAVVLFTTEEAS